MNVETLIPASWCTHHISQTVPVSLCAHHIWQTVSASSHHTNAYGASSHHIYARSELCVTLPETLQCMLCIWSRLLLSPLSLRQSTTRRPNIPYVWPIVKRTEITLCWLACSASLAPEQPENPKWGNNSPYCFRSVAFFSHLLLLSVL